MTTDQNHNDSEIEQACPGGFMGRQPGGEHCWSVPTKEGHQECLWCAARRQLRIVPMQEDLRRQIEVVKTYPEMDFENLFFV